MMVLAVEDQSDLDAETIEGLRELGEDDDTFLCELINLFRTDSVERLAGLERAAQSGESAVIRTLAHALCGSSANVGAMGVSAACRAIDHLRADDDAALYADAVNNVRRAYDRVIPLLDCFGSTGSDPGPRLGPGFAPLSSDDVSPPAQRR